MKMTSRLFAAALISAALATPAMADNPYVSLDLGQSTAKDACSTAGLPAGSTVAGCKDTGTTVRVGIGTQFAPQVSGEVTYASYGSGAVGTISVPGFLPIAGGDWKLSGFQLAGIGMLPVSDVVSVTGKLGVASTKLELTAISRSATSTTLTFGVGVQFRLNTDAAVRLQYENLGTVGDATTTGQVKVSLLTAGVVYKF